MKKLVIHPIPPLFNRESKVLILGSFPSVKSREQGFFYGHPQNRFWKVLAKIKEDKIPDTIEEKKDFILKNNLALWDTLASCEIEGSADSTIKQAKANDLSVILDNSKVDKIFVNGKTAKKYYDKYIKDKLQIEAVCLPSTSPANASFTVEKLVEEWKIIFEE